MPKGKSPVFVHHAVRLTLNVADNIPMAANDIKQTWDAAVRLEWSTVETNAVSTNPAIVGFVKGRPMPESFGLPCGRNDCTGRCRVLSVRHSVRDHHLRRFRICRFCGWCKRTITHESTARQGSSTTGKQIADFNPGLKIFWHFEAVSGGMKTGLTSQGKANTPQRSNGVLVK